MTSAALYRWLQIIESYIPAGEIRPVTLRKVGFFTYTVTPRDQEISASAPLPPGDYGYFSPFSFNYACCISYYFAADEPPFPYSLPHVASFKEHVTSLGKYPDNHPGNHPGHFKVAMDLVHSLNSMALSHLTNSKVQYPRFHHDFCSSA